MSAKTSQVITMRFEAGSLRWRARLALVLLGIGLKGLAFWLADHATETTETDEASAVAG